jgi:transcriptional regulator with XRE-family HTH domain
MRAVDRHVGLRTRLRREELGISRELLAKEIGQPVERLTSYENGWIRMEPATLLQLSISLRLPLSKFFADLDPSRACSKAVERGPAIDTVSHLPVRMPAFAFDGGVDASVAGATFSRGKAKAQSIPWVERVIAAHMLEPIDALCSTQDRNETDEPRKMPYLFPLAILMMTIFAAGLGVMSALGFVFIPIIQHLVHSAFSGP